PGDRGAGERLTAQQELVGAGAGGDVGAATSALYPLPMTRSTEASARVSWVGTAPSTSLLTSSDPALPLGPNRTSAGASIFFLSVSLATWPMTKPRALTSLAVAAASPARFVAL